MRFCEWARNWSSVGILVASFSFGLNGCTGNKQADQAKVAPQKTEKKGNSGNETKTIASTLRFQDVFDSSGIQHQYDDGRTAEVYSIVESLGGGVSILDFDRDGQLDLLYTGGGSFEKEKKLVSGISCGLFRGKGSFQFTSSTNQSSLVADAFYNHAAICADYDNDGFEDVVVTGYGGLQLFRNQGDGTFERRDQGAAMLDPKWSSAAGWGDVDSDGDLDLYVAHYADWSFENDPPCINNGVRDVCGPRDFQGVQHTFFINNGDGTFNDATSQIGLIPGGRGLGVLAADLDADGDVEFFVGNDEEANFLYRNDQGKFSEIGVRSGTGLDDQGSPDGNMGIGLGDYDRDGRFDIFVTHYETETCALYTNKGRLAFKHDSRKTNITSMGNLFVGWGIAFVDFDHDMDEDILIVNGHAVRHSAMSPIDQVPVLMENQNGSSFVNSAETAGSFFGVPRSARGLAIGDFDHNGKMDAATSTVLQPHSLLKNESTTSPSSSHWLQLRLTGTRSNRNAIGAIVQVRAGGKILARQVYGGGSYNSTSERVLHFGIGSTTEIDSIEIQWPGRGNVPVERIKLDKLKVDQAWHWVEGASEPVLEDF